MEFINWKLIKNPANWVIVFLMVAIGAIAIHLVLTHYAQISGGSQG